MLKFGSVEIRQRLHAALSTVKDSLIESLLSDLMSRNESHGLAGVVYEEWVNVRVKKKGSTIVFAGSQLPVNKKNPEICKHEIDTDSLVAFCFHNFGDLKGQLKKLVENREGKNPFCCYGFSRTRIHEAIVAVLLWSSTDANGNVTLCFAGIQYTTTNTRHPVSENGVVLLQKCGEAVGATQTELWFTQPKQCMVEGASLKMLRQALKFEKPRPVDSSQTKKRKRATSSKGKSARSAKPPAPKKKSVVTSNKQRHWNVEAKKVSQYVMITTMTEKLEEKKVTTTFQDEVNNLFLKEASAGSTDSSEQVTSDMDMDMEIETNNGDFLRPWKETIEVASSLLEKNDASFLHPALTDLIEKANIDSTMDTATIGREEDDTSSNAE